MKNEITLEELLKQITPLPWNLYGPHIYKEGKLGSNVASAGSPRAKKEVGYTELDCTDADLHEAYKNAAYLTHCANVLPELVEAVRNHLKGDIRGTSVFRNHKPLRQALSRAEKVKLP